jgi:uncharacterized repeat protein (TIGR01451 family)
MLRAVVAISTVVAALSTFVAFGPAASAAPSADVSLDKSAPATVPSNSNLTYTIVVNNTGPDTATSIDVVDALPTGTTFVSATGAGFTFTTPTVGSNGTVHATMPSLPITSVQVLITVHVTTAIGVGNAVINTASVKSDADPNGANDVDTTNTTVTAASADLSIVKSAPSTVAPGGNITYTLNMLNGGPSDASGLVVSDTIPSGTTFVSASAPPGTAVSAPPVGGTGTVTITAPTFFAGFPEVANITVKVPPGTALGTVISNTATINSSTTDPSPSNNSSSVSTTIGTVPAVSITATTPTAFEGSSQGLFTFTRSGASTVGNLNIVTSISGTATSGTDYTALGTVTIPDGQASVTKPVVALADGVLDDGETVVVTVLAGSGYTVGSPSVATVTIREPGGSPPFCSPAPLSTYTDRAAAGVHARNVDCITWYGIARGFPDGTYGPGLQVTRAQMATFLSRLIARSTTALPPSPPNAFPGDDGGVHELAINQLAALGVLDGTTGEQGTSYGVSQPMRRDDMAKMLFNAHRVITGTALPAGPDAFTDDTNGGDPHAAGTDDEAAINALAQAGVVQGTGSSLYNPTGTVTRGQFASFFVRIMQILVTGGFIPPSPP